MILNPKQINDLLKIIDTNQAIFISKQFGPDFLTEYDISLLDDYGVSVEELYSEANDSIYTAFHLGMLAQSLDDNKALQELDYNTLEEYISRGDYIPLTEVERVAIQDLKLQSLSDIRALNGRIFQSVNGELINIGRQAQEQLLKEEMIEGVLRKKTARQVANQISERIGTWNRDFDRIVEFQMNSAYQEGRASFLQTYSGEKDPLVYKQVFSSGCQHCVKLYLTKGVGSPPKIFRLSELKANGTNIGRKTSDWKPTIGSTHPYCRCLLHKYPIGMSWDEEKKSFSIKDTKNVVLKKPRQKIGITIAGVKTFV